jgi:DHA1 family tetracycline resistance protein-like MFS transporter
LSRIAPLLSATCVNLIALGIILPVLPFYVTKFGAGPEVAVLIFSMFSGASLLTAPWWGRLSDRIGRKPVLLIGVTGTCISYIWLANADSLWEVFASRGFAGATAGWLTASQAYIADVTTAKNRAKGLGMLGATFGIAFVVGPGITYMALGGGGDLVFPAYVAAGCTAAGLLLALILIKEPETRETGSNTRFSMAILRTPTLFRLFAVYFAIFLAFTGLEATFALWCRDLFEFGPREVTPYFVFIGIVAALVQGGMIGPIVKQLGEARTVVLGIVTLALGLGLLPAAGTPWLVLLPMGLIVFGFSVIGPATQSLMSQVAPADLKGGVLGVAQSFASAARIAGPAWAGAVFAGIGPHWPYFIGALLLFPVALAALPLIRTPAAQEE